MTQREPCLDRSVHIVTNQDQGKKGQQNLQDRREKPIRRHDEGRLKREGLEKLMGKWEHGGIVSLIEYLRFPLQGLP